MKQIFAFLFAVIVLFVCLGWAFFSHSWIHIDYGTSLSLPIEWAKIGIGVLILFSFIALFTLGEIVYEQIFE